MAKDTKRRVSKEYSDTRDDDAFWAALDMRKEPLKQKWYLPVVLVLTLLSVPWFLAEGSIGTVVGGLPVWVWLGLGCSIGVSFVTAIAVLWFWVDQNEED